MKKRRAGTHDYKRNGTTTLFAALDVLKGQLIGQCMKRHRHREFLAFLKIIDRSTPERGLAIYEIDFRLETREALTFKKGPFLFA